jgi:cytochrome P450
MMEMTELAAKAHEQAMSMPLEDFDVGHPALFQADTIWPYFARLRREAPVHYSRGSLFGPYWSITKYRDVLEIESDHETFSSDARYGGITLKDTREGFRLPMFIAMDPPEHGPKRAAVSPIAATGYLQELEAQVRSWATEILDGLPIGEEFDWVDRVAVELTSQMLATMFDFPRAERRKLIYWSDIATATVESGKIASEAEREKILFEMRDVFLEIWKDRAKAAPRRDLISLMAHSPATQNMTAMEFLANIMLLLVGGNDSTRSSITGGLLALNQNPDEYRKLRDNPALIQSLVPEIIRWQSPIAHQRRTATRDIEFRGQHIRQGDKVAMWYVSANRDEEMIPQADRFIVDRDRPKRHLAFGFGIHRCMGERVAEMQLRILWEECLKRHPNIEVVGPPRRSFSVFVKGYESLPVRIPA